MIVDYYLKFENNDELFLPEMILNKAQWKIILLLCLGVELIWCKTYQYNNGKLFKFWNNKKIIWIDLIIFEKIEYSKFYIESNLHRNSDFECTQKVIIFINLYIYNIDNKMWQICWQKKKKLPI